MPSVDISAALLVKLKATAGVTALVGTSADARIFPEDLKQATTIPAVTISRTATEAITYLGGRSGLNRATFQVVSYGATRAAADALDIAIYDALGETANQTWDAVKVTNCYSVPGGRDAGDDVPLDASDVRRYWARSMYEVYYFDS